MDKRYKFAANGKTYFKNVSLDNEQKFFDLYWKYNPVLVSDEPSKSIQETDPSQQLSTKDKLKRKFIGAAGKAILPFGIGEIFQHGVEKLDTKEKQINLKHKWIIGFII